ncbi:MAG: glycosyltransferase family 4 protein [Nitrospira sp.]|jgi:glycosyltransferase involved in cell wall biosynthesis|nr:glycosyltransferase family 4 protein [Nitrospira sp.]MDH4242193.1 glycosyltransferase family 4 protein [Nitrospira sp.]MDH4357030.1 glycosyltransferase family 4 protein [Nitrospira sp.]MDH5317589.1 glycosyltransferase family 4 protein [Nitrospira sp.]
MRVLLIFSSSELGGAERSLTRMALAESNGVEYTLATMDGAGPWVDWCEQHGVSPVGLGAGNANSRHGVSRIRSLINLVKLARRERYDFLYVIGFRVSLYLRFLKPILRGARLVHGIRWNPDSNSRLDRAVRLTERVFGALVDGYVCNSKVAADTLIKRASVPSTKVNVIYNGLDRLPPPEDNLSDRPPNILVLANLAPRKGHIDFLDVVTAVRRQVPRAHFFFVGRDEMGGQIDKEIARRALKDAVTLTGFQADIAPWFDSSRLMVLPSLWGEGCPTSILEGFAHGLPVIAYAVDGVPELIEDGSDGVLVPPQDSASMARAVVHMLEDPDLAASMGENGREKVGRSFTLAHCANRHVDLFLNWR